MSLKFSTINGAKNTLRIYRSWSDHWATLSTYFKYPDAVRKLIYTTNAIEGFNRQLRKVTKSRTVFPSDNSLLKMLYLATMDITKNGRADAKTGVRSARNLRSISKRDWRTRRSKVIFFIDMYKYCCIMQTKGEAY